MHGKYQILIGDCIHHLKQMPDESIQCCVTSPPYWNLRDYGCVGQIGIEPTMNDYIQKMVEVFTEVKRVLRKDGTLWLNIGDGYFNKNLLMIPARVAIALQESGWYLRDAIIWHKSNPMPGSQKDRCTFAYEHVFMLSKSKHYYFDWEAIAEPVKETSKKRLDQDLENQIGSDRANVGKKTNGNMKAACSRLPGIVRNRVLQYNSKENKLHGKKQDGTGNSTYTGFNDRYESPEIAMKRNVWTIPTQPTKEAHFATFPEALVEPCILAGCQPDGIVLDPFLGSGTTMLVALRLSRKCIGIEMNKSYLSIIKKRILPYENMLI